MFKLIQISDTHFSAAAPNDGWSDVAALIEMVRPDVVIHTGDLVRDRPDEMADHLLARRRLDALQVAWQALPGNHDVGDGPPATPTITDGQLAAFEAGYGAAHWLRDAEDWRLIGVNSMLFGSGLDAEAAEWDFLHAALSGAGRRETALFVHKPPFLSHPGEKVAGTAAMAAEAGARLWAVAREQGVRLIACGHRHEYRVVHREGIAIVWAPTPHAFALGEQTPPLHPAGTRPGLVEYVFDGPTVMHRFVDTGLGVSSLEPGLVTDLRSDVLAPLPPRVFAAMAAASRGSKGFSRYEDRPQQQLIGQLAAWFGFEDGLFLPTGTMANQVALRLWCHPGEAVLAEAESHLAVNEAASVAGLNGVTVRTIAGERGHLSPAIVASAAAELPGSAPDRRLRLVWLENTHNRAGGTVMPEGWLAEIASFAVGRDLPIHVDGARIFDAVHAQTIGTAEIAHGASSLSICLTKGPAAPHGAVLLGSRSYIAEAERVQKMFGGLWRPASLLAAAALAALEAWPERVAIAHERARELAAGLASSLPEGASVAPPDTNIVMLQLRGDEHVVRVLDRLAKSDVRASNYRRGRIRFVTHYGHTKEDIAHVSEMVGLAVRAE